MSKRETEIPLPDLNGYGKTALKEQVERHFKCYICEFKSNCNFEAKKIRRCIPRDKAIAILNAIDYAVDSIREQNKK